MRTTATIIALLFFFASTGPAQQTPPTCGLASMTDGAAPIFTPIAKAAHVGGTVVMLAAFKLTGEVESVQVVSGPEMLRQSAVNYVKGWRANAYSGPRTCPVSISYKLYNPGDREVPPIVRSDLQHVTLTSQPALIQPSFSRVANAY
jgi:hypothetical protein